MKNKGMLFAYFVVFLISGTLYALVNYMFGRYAQDLSADEAGAQAVRSGLFFGALIVAVWLIIRPRKKI